MNAPYAAEQLKRTTQGEATDTDMDLVAACRTDATILFTGSSEVAESIARAIHESSGWRSGPFIVVDCSRQDPELDALLTCLLSWDSGVDEFRKTRALPSQQGIVFLRGVERLSRSAQIMVADWLARVRPSGKLGPRRRVIASTRESLLPRVIAGTFDDRLYYRLSVIHIALESAKES